MVRSSRCGPTPSPVASEPEGRCGVCKAPHDLTEEDPDRTDRLPPGHSQPPFSAHPPPPSFLLFHNPPFALHTHTQRERLGRRFFRTEHIPPQASTPPLDRHRFSPSPSLWSLLPDPLFVATSISSLAFCFGKTRHTIYQIFPQSRRPHPTGLGGPPQFLAGSQPPVSPQPPGPPLPIDLLLPRGQWRERAARPFSQSAVFWPPEAGLPSPSPSTLTLTLHTPPSPYRGGGGVWRCPKV